ncbi:MAG: hypothetical protein EZS26_000971 [Candidatus Ordinivivax streblomastigis]|uniref:Uncharacterized protein n=1 Tax=Candidatus Ordinivivax streblomastigis TaxID=2540710 RepID=A0A5M8P310_9BACT|nr:MAG: hypothetical protein EZS26_000971 [Candidatus Ordinivivax streblomastigis]
MADKRILTSRIWHTDGSWYAPKRFIKETFSSVVYCNYIETSSSAGDWTGVIIQKLGKKLYATIFSQENSFPCCNGFDIYTSKDVIAIYDGTKITDYSQLFNDICTIVYENETNKPDNLDTRIQDLLAEDSIVALYFVTGIGVLKERIDSMNDEEIIKMFSSFLHPQRVRNNVEHLYKKLNRLDG